MSERRGMGTCRTSIEASSAALTAKLAPSRTKAQPGPAVNTSAPATAGPPIRVALLTTAIRALARSSSDASTVPRISGETVGIEKAPAAPPIASARAICHSAGVPESSSAPTKSWVAHRTRSVVSATVRALKRSPATPPSGSRSSLGTIAQASTRARSPVEPVAR